ncbi:MAG TPA: VanZ family protein [Candidatus Nitrosotalea sp.]|nr:VanZ family protein [Candidatus Nitrosotalea sp.]
MEQDFELDDAGPVLSSHIVSARNSFLKYWLPALVCAGLIFGGSTDLLSSRRTSRFIRPILLWFKPDLSEESVSEIVLVIRKMGHVTEYAILGMLIWRALRKPVRNKPRPWSRREAILSVLAAGAYAATDEWHQSFVATRFASPMDVLLDTFGASVGLFLLWGIGKFRRRW